MTRKRKSNPKSDQGGRKRMLDGSRRGSALVRLEFRAVITRKRFCEAVGIHPSTLKRWERAGIVEPAMQTILGSPTAVFRPDDVEFGRLVARELRENFGQLSTGEAARRARRELGSQPSRTSH